MDQTYKVEINQSIKNIIIRPLEKEDLPALEWDGEYRHFRNVFADLYSKITKGLAKAWVATTQDNFMVGQVFLQISSDRHELANGWNRAYLYSFRIRPEFRNQGLGTEVLNILEDSLREMNFNRLTLNVARDNEGAIRLYHKHGFKIVAEEPGIWSYPDHNGVWQTVHEPSWRMEKTLD